MARNNNGVFEPPVKLSSAINAFYFHGHVFISPDESCMVFDAIPTQQSTGSSIYTSFKKPDGTWCNPIKLNNDINSTGNQYLPSLSPDGKYLFFTRDGDIWWVNAKVVNDLKPATGIRYKSGLLPETFQLFQNYPNPFNPSTEISFSLPFTNKVSLIVYDLLGHTVRTLVADNEVVKDSHSVQWNGKNDSGSSVSSGTYIYTLRSGSIEKSRKMILLK
jgi:hypothetical protein